MGTVFFYPQSIIRRSMMNCLSVFKTTLLSVILTAGAAVAQDAYLAQIGDGHVGANFAAGSGNAQALIQQGVRHTALQYTAGTNNTSQTVQTGLFNTSLIANIGADNRASTVQMGLGNQSAVAIFGLDNGVTTLQAGAFNQSSVALFGNRTDVEVQQYGVKRRVDLLVSDQMVASTAQTSQSLNNGRFQVGVIQGRNDAPVTASITRTANGSLIIRP
jgi:hypothetical protein